MKRQVRANVFETNSSSVHTLTICTAEEYDKWMNGEMIFDYWSRELKESFKISDEIIKEARHRYDQTKTEYYKEWEELDEKTRIKYCHKYMSESGDYGNDDQMTFDEFFDNYDYETYVEEFTTPSGDKMVAFGRYGYDG